MKTTLYCVALALSLVLMTAPAPASSEDDDDDIFGNFEEPNERGRDEYLEDLLDVLNTIQPSENKGAMAAEEGATAPVVENYIKDLFDSLIDAIYGPETGSEAGETEEEPEEDGDDGSPVSYVATTPEAGAEENDDSDEDVITVTTAAPVPPTDDDDDDGNEDADDEAAATTVAPVPTTDDDNENDDEEDDEDETTTTAPVATTDDDNEDDEDDEDDDDVTTTQAPVTTTQKVVVTTDDNDRDDENETPTTVTTIDRTLSTIDDADDDNDDDDDDDDDDSEEDEVTTQATTTTATSTTTTSATTTTTTMATTTDEDEDDSTTVTAAPVTTPAVPDLCDGCLFQHGVGYNPHPSDCTLFVQCQLNQDGVPVVAGVQSCPHGLYWNQDKLTCDYPKNVNCEDDICRSTSVKTTKRSASSCRGYWDCSSGVAEDLCCAAGFAYNPVTEACHYDPGCQQDCHHSQPPPVSYECNGMRSVAGDRNAYEVKTWDTWTLMRCPPTLAFIDSPCGCNELLETPPPQPECAREIHLPFDKDASDRSNSGLWVDNQGVRVSDGKAYFDGKSRLMIPFYSGLPWGSIVYVHIRYKLHPAASTARYALVTNGDCQQRPSLAVCAGPQRVDFYAETGGSDMPANFTVPLASSGLGEGWRDVLYQLDESRLIGFVDHQSAQAPAPGPLETRYRALVIGSGGGCEDLYGFIDELSVYRCRPLR